MKVLVLGGCGFIGSHLVEVLVKRGDEVTVIDNLSTGTMKNLENVISDIHFMERNVHNPSVDLHMDEANVVFHLANPACGTAYEVNPMSATNNAIGGFMNVLEQAKVSKVWKVIYASSASIFGKYSCAEQLAVPFSIYGETRRFFERVAYIYSKYYGLSTVGVRLFSVYGPRSENKQGYASVVNQFVKAMMRGEQPEIWGDGSQKRDYIYIDEVVDVFLNVADETPSEYVVEVGSGKSTSYNELVERINVGLGTEISPKYIEREFENYVEETLCLDAKYPLKITLDEGIRKLIKYYREKDVF